MIPLIDYLRALIHPLNSSNPFLEITAWSLIQKLSAFQWRIPTVWHDIVAQAKELLDHPSKIIREQIVRWAELKHDLLLFYSLINFFHGLCFSAVVTSLAYDIQFPNNQTKRHPTIDNFFELIRDRFYHSVHIYENAQSGRNSRRLILSSTFKDLHLSFRKKHWDSSSSECHRSK